MIIGTSEGLVFCFKLMVFNCILFWLPSLWAACVHVFMCTCTCVRGGGMGGGGGGGGQGGASAPPGPPPQNSYY